jgi:thiol-disulfide isomerase/thioredoxin
MLKKIIVLVIIANGLITLGLISYSFFTNRANAGRFVLLEGTGIFAENPRELKSEVAAELGYLAPDFALRDLSGKTVRLSDFRGQPLLLNFWATWCPPCRKEMPELEKFHQEYGEQIVLLGVNWGEEASSIQEFLDGFAIKYPNLLDERGTAFVQYRLTGIPTSFFIDGQGFIRGVWLGPLRVTEIAGHFERLKLLAQNDGK